MTGDSWCVPILEQRKARFITLLRYAAMLLLLAASAVTPWITYDLMRRAEQRSFIASYDDAVNTLTNVMGSGLRSKVDASVALSLMYTTAFPVHVPSWPNVTLNNFYQLAGAISVDLGGARGMAFVPYVTNETRPGFEAYAIEAEHQLDRCYEECEGYVMWPVSAGIFQLVDGVPSPIPPHSRCHYFPMWQVRFHFHSIGEAYIRLMS